MGHKGNQRVIYPVRWVMLSAISSLNSPCIVLLLSCSQTETYCCAIEVNVWIWMRQLKLPTSTRGLFEYQKIILRCERNKKFGSCVRRCSPPRLMFRRRQTRTASCHSTWIPVRVLTSAINCASPQKAMMQIFQKVSALKNLLWKPRCLSCVWILPLIHFNQAVNSRVSLIQVSETIPASLMYLWPTIFPDFGAWRANPKFDAKNSTTKPGVEWTSATHKRQKETKHKVMLQCVTPQKHNPVHSCQHVFPD